MTKSAAPQSPNARICDRMMHLRAVRLAAAAASVPFSAALFSVGAHTPPPYIAWILGVLCAWSLPAFVAARGGLVLDPNWDSACPAPGSPESLVPWQRPTIPWRAALNFALPPLLWVALFIFSHRSFCTAGTETMFSTTTSLVTLLFLGFLYLFQAPLQSWTRHAARPAQLQIGLLLLGSASLIHVAILGFAPPARPQVEILLAIPPAMLALLGCYFLGYRIRSVKLSPKTRLAIFAGAGTILPLGALGAIYFSPTLGATRTAVLFLSPANPIVLSVAGALFLLHGNLAGRRIPLSLSQLAVGIMMVHPTLICLSRQMTKNLSPTMATALLAMGVLVASGLLVAAIQRIPRLRRVLG